MKKNVLMLLRNFLSHEVNIVYLLLHLFGTTVHRALLTILDVTQVQPTPDSSALTEFFRIINISLMFSSMSGNHA